MPSDVSGEIEAGRALYPNIASVNSTAWAHILVLTEEEAWIQLKIKASLGGSPTEHLGECAVIACAYTRGLIALLDDRAAIAQANRYHVASRSTLWIVVEAFRVLFPHDRPRAEAIVDDLLATDMRLPVRSGSGLWMRAYEEGLLP